MKKKRIISATSESKDIIERELWLFRSLEGSGQLISDWDNCQFFSFQMHNSDVLLLFCVFFLSTHLLTAFTMQASSSLQKMKQNL